MGFFTWTLANRKVEKTKLGIDYKNKCKLPYDGYGCVMCPDGTVIEEKCYEGYGIFDGHDVYELVVDWNRGHLLQTLVVNDNMNEKDANFYRGIAQRLDANDDDGARAYAEELVDKGEAPKYLRTDWKRCLGIELTHGPTQPPYPIKITDTPNPRKKYDDLPASIGCQ